MNSRCNKCYQSPCQCHTTCRPPAVCIPSAPRRKPKLPTVSVEGLIKMIESKCDKTTCAILQDELTLLYVLLGLEDHRPTPPTNRPGYPVPPDPGYPVPPVIGPPYPIPPIVNPPITPPVLPGVAFQLIANMVESLEGDLKGKYPSAELLKVQLHALWSCMYNKQQHHGEWKDNFTIRKVDEADNQCLLDGGKDNAPKTLKVYIPVDVGSTVFHTIEGRKCLFESLVDNNIEEPSKKAVLEGKWMNYCDIKDVIDCVLPRQLTANCHGKCDDPNKDGVHEDKTMCERMKAVEAYMKAHP